MKRIICLLMLFALLLCGCQKDEYSKYYSVEKSGDEYEYTIKTRDGEVIVNESVKAETTVTVVGEDLLRLDINWNGNRATTASVFYDIATGDVSHPFSYLLDQQGTRILQAERVAGEYSVFVKDIFDTTVSKRFILTDVASEDEPIISATFSEDGEKATVEFLTVGGEQKTATFTAK